MKRFRYLVLFLVLFLLGACATRNERFVDIDAKVDKGEYQQAKDLIESDKKNLYGNKDQVLYLLDTGLLDFYSNDLERAINSLSQADLQMDELRLVNIGEQIGASLFNDSVLTYNGANYEYVFTSLILSLGYLMKNQFDAGFVEMRRSQDKLTKIQVDNDVRISEYSKNKDSVVKIDAIKEPFVDSAFARLLSFWVYRKDFDFTNMEVAARKYSEAIKAQPRLYSFTPPEITGEHFATGGTRIQVITLTGRAPILYEKKFSLNAVSKGIIISSYSGADSLPPRVTPVDGNNFFGGLGIIPIGNLSDTGFSIVFSVPGLATFQRKVDRIEVLVNGEEQGTLSLTEDLETIATQTFEEEKKYIYARQLSRIIVKTVLGVSANEASSVLGLAAQIINNVTEVADIRISRFFPARIWSSDFEVEGPGSYKITVVYYNKGTRILEKEQVIEITQENDTLNLVLDTLL